MAKTPHPFAQAFECDRVPVALVPLSPEHPTGHRWERACLCPDWQELDSEIVERVDMVNGKPVPVKRLIKISGCGRKLLLWAMSSTGRQAQAALAETVAHREETDKLKGVLAEIGAGVGYAAYVLAAGRNDAEAHKSDKAALIETVKVRLLNAD